MLKFLIALLQTSIFNKVSVLMTEETCIPVIDVTENPKDLKFCT